MDLGDENLQPIRMLGEGTFGRVFLCHCRKGKYVQQVCVKRIIVQNPRLQMKMLQDEVYIISQLKHPRIVQFIRSFTHAGTINIVMEYLNNGTMRDVINQTSTKGGIKKTDLIKFFLDMLMGLEYLHIRHVTHRDIKPENLLIDHNQRIKYADFGISGIQHHATVKEPFKSAGTPLYAAPEVLRSESFDFKSDVWSLGCVLYEMCMGKHPFREAKDFKDLRNIIRTITRPHLKCSKISEIYGTVIGSMCERMIAYDLSQRISLPSLIASDQMITLPYYERYFEYDYNENLE